MKSSRLYIFATVFVLGWWILAFAPSSNTYTLVTAAHKSSLLETSSSSPYLYPISRQKLHQALLGDAEIMISLMAQWDTEARLLAFCEASNSQRLSSNKYLKAQLLGRRIQAREQGIDTTEYPTRFNETADDAGAFHDSRRRERFLPQTYVAASFLLALTEPEQIVALPKGLRDLHNLYPAELLDRIPLDCGPYQTESLLKLRPDIAFIAPYSMPATRQALANQGIELFTISNINTLEEIQDALLKVGDVSGRPEEAELLALFMEAAICALDNRLLYAEKKKKDVLYLNYYSKFAAPTDHTLAGSLLHRLGINQFAHLKASSNHWQIPLENERIARLQPQAIILSASNGTELKSLVMNHPAFRDVPAIKTGQIFAVDASIQDSSSQFAILAYYDLVNALLEVDQQ
ncbi:MAG: ABC transporter substrate-binding protein [Chlamydiales bacterium]|nr:ABC transporter substrate-binding protein [Chlamydiales bacterium]